MNIRLDLHNHTSFSHDGTLSPGRLLELAARRGLHCIAVTDHGTLAGAEVCVQIAADDPRLPRVIPGEEVMTEAGELVALFLEEEVPAGLSVEETVARIHEQGGLAYLPHPFDSIRRAAITAQMRERAAELADIIEVRNGRMLLPVFNWRAFELARRLAKPMGAGSDAHYAGEVGRAFLEVAALPQRDTLVQLVREGRLGPPLSAAGEAKAWLYHLRTGWGKLLRYAGRRLPGSPRP